jgi:hypothetical protein
LQRLPQAGAALVWIGVAVPVIESGVGLALLSRRFRNAAVTVAVALHGVILLVFGPLGHNFNTILWPWNLAMAAFVVVLFWQAHTPTAHGIVASSNGPHRIVIVLFGVLPLGSFLNVWDSFPSWTLFSANTNTATIRVDPRTLPKALRSYVRIENAVSVLDPMFWSLGELNVPVYPETRIFRALGSKLCELTAQDPSLRLLVSGRPALINRDAPAAYGCADLRSGR